MPTFNTTDPKPGYVYDAATDTWFPLLGIAPGSSVVRWRKTAAGAETSVSGLDDLGATLSYNAGTEQVYLNGVLLVRTEDYLATTGTSVTGLTALAASDVIEVISFNATNVQITDALLETDINAKGDLIVGAAVDTAAILASGTNGQVLSVNTATATGLEWVTSDDANAIQNAIVDAKGDIIAATAADTVARLAVGANGTVLTAASGEATGLSWATPSSGGMTLLSTTTLSGGTTTISGIASGYNYLYLVMTGFDVTSSSGIATIKPNNDSSLFYGVYFGNSNAQYDAIRVDASDLEWTESANFSNAMTDFCSVMKIDNYSSTTNFKPVEQIGYWNNNGPVYSISHSGVFRSNSAITSLTFTSAGTWAAGTVKIYGVK